MAVALREPRAEPGVAPLVVRGAPQQRRDRRVRVEARDDRSQPREPARCLVLDAAAERPRFCSPAPQGCVHQPETPPPLSGFTPASAAVEEPAAVEPPPDAVLSEPDWLEDVVEQPEVPPSTAPPT